MCGYEGIGSCAVLHTTTQTINCKGRHCAHDVYCRGYLINGSGA